MIIATEKHENKKVWNEQKDLDFFLDFDLEVLSWDLPGLISLYLFKFEIE